VPNKVYFAVAIAQLVEPRIVIPVVVGSSPISHPNIEKPASIEAGFFPFAFHGYLSFMGIYKA
jgi:hypothetical protein